MPGVDARDNKEGAGFSSKNSGRKKKETTAKSFGVPRLDNDGQHNPMPELVFNPQAVSNALYGLQNMGCGYSEVRELLKVLSGFIYYSQQQYKIRRTSMSLTPQHVGNTLYGLQNMSSATVEVQLLLRTLVPLLITSNEENVLPSNIDNALYGMKKMTASDCPEVRNILSLLNIKLQSCSVPWKVNNIARSVYGLQNMSR